MPSGRGRSGCRWLAALSLALACGLAAGILLIALTLPEAITTLGAPDPSLDPVQRTLLSVYLVVRAPSLDQAAGESSAAAEVVVEPGESAGVVVNRLRDEGVVRNTTLLRAYLRYRGIDRSVQAGRYRLQGSMSVRQIADALQHAATPAVVVTIPEGRRLEEVAASLESAPFSADAFLAAARARREGYSFSSELAADDSLEGFLFPDTYHLTQDSAADDLVAAMLDNFERRVTPEIREGFTRQGLTLRQAVTLASIVEREAAVADERPLIASVFLNRLAQGMKLDADPTVQYLLGMQPDGSWWKAPLSLEDLQVDSSYNTYLYPGLPPGPIASPGLSSLQAVASPASTPYLYFRAACDGSGRHLFAETLEQQLQNACP